MIAALSAVSAMAVLLAAGAAPASAIGPYTVNDTVDAIDSNVMDGQCESSPGNCTLRAAIMQANEDGGGTVRLSQGLGDIHLTIPPGDEGVETPTLTCVRPIPNPPPPNNCGNSRTGDLDIFTDIHVIGNGVANSIIDGLHLTRIFDVHDIPSIHGSRAFHGSLELSDLTLQNGTSEWDGEAQHAHGGAIHNHGTITLERVAVIDSTSKRPSHSWGGGGITNAAGATAHLINVTVAGNSSNFEGGGIENKGTLSLAYTTITDNSAPGPTCVGTHIPPSGRGRGARRLPRPCERSHGGGLFLAAGSTTSVLDTIVAKNGVGKDCAGDGGPITFKSFGGNVSDDGSCNFNHPTDRRGDPEFDPGAPGPPRWWPLLPSSPAVDVPTTVLCYPGVLGDILGAARNRPAGGDPDGDGFLNCDSGSFELDPGALPRLSIRNARVREGQRGRKKIRFTVSLSPSHKYTVKVHVTTRDRTARAGVDYVARSATLVFKPHQRHKTFTVAVIGDHKREKNETFTVHLSDAKGTRITDAEATGTIVNDD